MKFASRLFNSSIGKKWIVGLTGLGLLAFLFGHLAGNMLYFLGEDHMNAYAHFLKSNIELLWGARIGLIVIFVLHIYTSIRLSKENKAARPEGYTSGKVYKASWASRYMLISGLTILAFVIYHLLHYTLVIEAVNLTGVDFGELHDEQGRHDVYAMMTIGFSQPIVSGFYVLCMVLLGAHLIHASSAVFQTIGLRDHINKPMFDKLSLAVTLILFIGFTSIPVSILLGIAGNGGH